MYEYGKACARTQYIQYKYFNKALQYGTRTVLYKYEYKYYL